MELPGSACPRCRGKVIHDPRGAAPYCLMCGWVYTDPEDLLRSQFEVQRLMTNPKGFRRR